MSTLYNSTAANEFCKEILQVGPGTNSLLPLNQLTLSGGVPLMTLVKVTLEPGIASCVSGFLTKEGGSRDVIII